MHWPESPGDNFPYRSRWRGALDLTTLTLSTLGLAALSSVALAQTPPDAGSLLRQIEQGRPPVLPKAQTGPASPAPLEMKTLAGPSLSVKAFRFTGNSLVGEDLLREVVRPYLNRPLNFAELQQAAVAVARAYREAGWIVRAYLPRQDIVEGVVTIQIVEAVFGGATLEGAPPGRLSLERLQGVVNAAHPVGTPANTDALDRALLLLADLPGAAVSGHLKAGPKEGETSLVLTSVDQALVSGDVGFDNAGGRASGATRMQGNLTLGSPAGLGDQAGFNVIHGEGNDYWRLGYTLPIGYAGWRVGFSASAMSYRLVAPEFLGLAARGDSTAAGLEASYPLLRTRLKNLYVLGNLERKHFNNLSGAISTSRYTVETFSLGLSGNLFDALGGGGANSAQLTLVSGRVDLDGSAHQAADAATTRTAGPFRKWRYAASRQQTLGQHLVAHISLSGQLASKNLDSAEKFYLGGPGGVRAYPAGEGGGSEGMMLNLELRQTLPGNLSLTGFYDRGWVTINHDNNFVGAASLNHYSLSGVGLALSWQTEFGMSVKGTWATRLGTNPNQTATGQDQDGSLVKDRFWLQALLSF